MTQVISVVSMIQAVKMSLVCQLRKPGQPTKKQSRRKCKKFSIKKFSKNKVWRNKIKNLYFSVRKNLNKKTNKKTALLTQLWIHNLKSKPRHRFCASTWHSTATNESGWKFSTRTTKTWTTESSECAKTTELSNKKRCRKSKKWSKNKSRSLKPKKKKQNKSNKSERRARSDNGPSRRRTCRLLLTSKSTKISCWID